MTYDIDTLPKSELFRLLIALHDKYEVDAIDVKRLQEEVCRQDLQCPQKIIEDMPETSKNDVDELSILCSQHIMEASINGLISAVIEYLKKIGKNSIPKVILGLIKKEIADTVRTNVSADSLPLYIDDQGHYKVEEVFELVTMKTQNNELKALLYNLYKTRMATGDIKLHGKYRLNKVAKNLNVGIQTIVQFLSKKGYQVDTNPNTKITAQQYYLVLTAFENERVVKQKESLRTGGNRVILATKNIDNKYDANNKKEQVEDNGDNNPKPMSKNARKKERRRAERRAMMATKVISE